MKLSILCPPEISVPLDGKYGGIELLAADLAEEAHKQGHDVTIFCTPSPGAPDWFKPYTADWRSQTLADDLVIDLTHEKLGVRPMNSKKNYMAMCLLTDRISGINDVFLSKTVKDGFPGAEGRVIYPGIANRFKYLPDFDRAHSYLLFLGRMAKIKRPDLAIHIAWRSGHAIAIAGHTGAYAMDPSWPELVRRMAATCNESRPGMVRVVENPTEEQKIALLSKAAALIAPSDWSMIGSRESFGIVAVEALLSGLPCITSGEGGLGEIVTPDVGYACSTFDEYVDAVKAVYAGKISSDACVKRGAYFSSARFLRDILAYWEECRR